MTTGSMEGGAPGSGLKVATHTVVEGGETRHLQRVVNSDSAGAEVVVATAAKQDAQTALLTSIQDSLDETETYAISTTPVTGVKRNSYIWAVTATFSGATIKLQALGPDGATYIDIDSMTASGRKGIGVGANATLRLAYTGGSPTSVLSSLT